MEAARRRAGRERDEGVPTSTSVRIDFPVMRRCGEIHVGNGKISIFLKCPTSESLERDEANQINNRYDEHGSR